MLHLVLEVKLQRCHNWNSHARGGSIVFKWEQLDYLFFPYEPLGWASWSLMCTMTSKHVLKPLQQRWVWTLHVHCIVEKRYCSYTLQAIGTTQIFMYARWLAMLS